MKSQTHRKCPQHEPSTRLKEPLCVGRGCQVLPGSSWELISVTVATRARNGERLRGSTSSSWSYCYPCLMRLNTLLIPASVLFSIIASVLILIPFISGKTKKGNIRPRSSLNFCCCLDCAFCHVLHGCAKCQYVFGSIAVLQSLLRRKAKLRK